MAKKINRMKPVEIVKQIVAMFKSGERYSTRCIHMQKRIGVNFAMLSVEEAEKEGKRLICIGNKRLAARMS